MIDIPAAPSPACPQASPVAPGQTEAADQTICATVLGLDCSSTTIGWCVYDGQVRDAGTLKLTGKDIAERCHQARAGLGLVLLNHPDVDAAAIESPVARYAKAVIPQARVNGAILSLLAEKQIAWVEVTPSEAKATLVGRGNASKAEMMAVATIQARGIAIPDEHAADAVGVAKAALKYVQVTR